MFSSIETIWKAVSSAFSEDGKPHLVTLQPPLSDDLLQEQYHDLIDESEKKPMYAVVLLLTAKFSDDHFNARSYLESINGLSISSKDENLIYSKIDEIYPDKKTKETDLKWWVSLAFNSKPTTSQQLNISLGPVSWTIPVGSLEWKQYHYEDSDTNGVWEGAQAQLDLKIDKPDWTLIRSARLLFTPKGDMTLLEVVVENLSDRPTPLNMLDIKSSGPRASSGDCYQDGGTLQLLVLNWDVLASHSDKGEQGAWTTINKVPVRVHASYQRAGTCNGSLLHAEVPISNEVPPKGLSKVQIAIRGVSSLREAHNKRIDQMGLHIPTATIGLNSEDDSPVYPRKVIIPIFKDEKQPSSQ